MKILFVGNVEFSKRMLEKLFSMGAPIAGVITKESSVFNADHVDLSTIAKQHHVPYLYVKDINTPESCVWARTLQTDVCYCFGISQLLGKEFLSLFTDGVIGYHPAALPYNRGRHPIIWALALGLERTASTFLFLTQEVDAGNIISQVEVTIDYEDDARSLYNKLSIQAEKQLEELYRLGQKGRLACQVQELPEGNIWRKRSQEDGRIHFCMGSRAIYNLVRALTRPYVGAHLVYRAQEIKVWKVREENVSCENLEPGKVLEVKKSQVLVKCYDNAVWLLEHEMLALPKVGDYVL